MVNGSKQRALHNYIEISRLKWVWMLADYLYLVLNNHFADIIIKLETSISQVSSLSMFNFSLRKVFFYDSVYQTGSWIYHKHFSTVAWTNLMNLHSLTASNNFLEFYGNMSITSACNNREYGWNIWQIGWLFLSQTAVLWKIIFNTRILTFLQSKFVLFVEKCLDCCLCITKWLPMQMTPSSGQWKGNPVQFRTDSSFKVVIHVEMPKAAPKKYIYKT